MQAGGGEGGVNYYNEFDRKSAAWLRELIECGEIPDGRVDERSICDVQPADLEGFTQCHFFAGIGGWSLALKLAGWPANRKVWTGSCPCQPFSTAGQGLGEADPRHLWPVFRNLIGECRAPIVFGEQVASAAGLQWLGGVCADMEAAGYAFGSSDLCAASVGAPHIRQRLYWVADSEGERRNGGSGMLGPNWRTVAETSSRMGNSNNTESAGGASQWCSYELIPCRDGKSRRIESGSFPLADGVPGRVGLLRGYGNAIVPQVAAEFIKAFVEIK